MPFSDLNFFFKYIGSLKEQSVENKTTVVNYNVKKKSIYIP